MTTIESIKQRAFMAVSRASEDTPLPAITDSVEFGYYHGRIQGLLTALMWLDDPALEDTAVVLYSEIKYALDWRKHHADRLDQGIDEEQVKKDK